MQWLTAIFKELAIFVYTQPWVIAIQNSLFELRVSPVLIMNFIGSYPPSS